MRRGELRRVRDPVAGQDAAAQDTKAATQMRYHEAC